MKGAPFCDATLERAANAVGKNVGAEFVLQILEDRHGHNAGGLSISRTRDQISVSGSERVRHVRGCLFCEGKRGSLSMRPAVRALKPAMAAAS
jgi:hypothetical protein